MKWFTIRVIVAIFMNLPIENSRFTNKCKVMNVMYTIRFTNI